MTGSEEAIHKYSKRSMDEWHLVMPVTPAKPALACSKPGTGVQYKKCACGAHYVIGSLPAPGILDSGLSGCVKTQILSSRGAAGDAAIHDYQ